MSGKGDNPRPFSVSEAEFAKNFDAIDWNARERERRVKPLDGRPLDGEQLLADRDWEAEL